MQSYAFRRFYLRPKYMIKRLSKIRSMEEFALRSVEGLGVLPKKYVRNQIQALKKGDYRLGGIVLALSVTSKYSMLIGVPIIFIYLWLNQDLKGGFWETLISFSAISVLIIAPYLISPGFWEMVIFNREVDKLYLMSINLGNDVRIYLLPII